MKKTLLILLSIFFCFSLFSILYLNKEKQDEVIYVDFISKIKGMEYLDGYKMLYPLSIQKDKKTLLYISRAYLGDYGVDMDIIKSNIWKERSEVCLYCETGYNEFRQYQTFLNKKDYGMASVFLQKSAEKGNKNAILLLKNNDFLEKNYLNIDPNWKKYWQDFDYDNLYPFCQDIEECRKDVESKKSTDTK